MNDARRYLEKALADNGVVELRHHAGSTWTTGWFDNANLLLKRAGDLSGAGNLFISLNRPSPRIAPNRMIGNPIGNGDIQFITRLFYDFDPVRPKHCPSTADELDHARRSASEAFKLHRAMGWPDPLTAISGNGTHLLYRCHLPNTQDVRDQLKVIYTGMQTDYSNDHVTFDRAVRNPGRICTLYGSIKRKGIATPTRPHRRSEILSWPREWKQVPRRNIEALAHFYGTRDEKTADRSVNSFSSPTSQKPVSGMGDYSTLDVIAWFSAHDFYEHPVEGVMHSVVCPWEDEHSETNPNDTIIFANTDGGWPGFHCKHSHCEGRTIRDVMEILGDADSFCAHPWEGQS